MTLINLKVNQLEKCDFAWGSYRRVVAKVDINEWAVVYLFKENSDGRGWVGVHDKETRESLGTFGIYWVQNNEDIQKALDKISETYNETVKKCYKEFMDALESQ